MATLPGTVLFRVNAGGPLIAATDSGPDWLADTNTNNSAFLLDPGSNSTFSFPAVEPGPSVASSVPGAIFDTERFDRAGGSNLQYAFDVPATGDYEVRLYLANGFLGTSAPGQRVFDVALEGSVPSNLNDVDLSAQFGSRIGGVISNVVTVDDGTLNIEFLHEVQNPLINGIEIVRLDDGGSPPAPPAPPQGDGEVILQVTRNNNNVQASNFADNSFRVINVGNKEIAQIDIDVTNALFPDTVFDPFGIAGDTASRPLTITADGGTGVDAPSNASYIGVGGTAGFEGLRITFDATVNGGFEPGEMLGFAIDMDPNSISGAQRSLLTAGSNPTFDVGGVSGAEIIGSTFTVTFADGTTATGQLQGDGSQAGAQALAAQNSPNIPVSLTVNGLGAGGVGTYDAGGPSVVVNGPAGETARIVLVKGFIQPVTNEFFNGTPSQQAFAPTFQAQLDALAAEDFPANNAVEFQTVDVVLTGANQNISNLFDFTGVANFDFEGEDALPLGFVASAIDPTNSNLPIGPVTAPIYLTREDDTIPPAPPESLSLSFDPSNLNEGDGIAAATGTVTRTGDTTSSLSVTLSNSDASEVSVPAVVTIPAGQASADFDVDAVDDGIVDGTQTVAIAASAAGFTGASANIAIADDDVAAPPAPPASSLSFQLVDAASDDLVGQLVAGGELTVGAEVDLTQVNIVAVVPDALEAESVVLDLNSQIQRTENVAPYALFGDQGGNFLAGTLALGSNTISAEVFSENRGLGDLLASETVEFTLSQL